MFKNDQNHNTGKYPYSLEKIGMILDQFHEPSSHGRGSRVKHGHDSWRDAPPYQPRDMNHAQHERFGFISSYTMTALDKKVLSGGKEQTVDLLQSSQVTRLLQELSRYGCLVIKDAAVDLPDSGILHHDSIIRNEVVVQFLRRARPQGSYALIHRELHDASRNDKKWRQSNNLESMQEGDQLQGIFCCHILSARDISYTFTFQSPSQMAKTIILNGQDIILITGATTWKIPEPSVPQVKPDIVELRYLWMDKRPLAK